MENKIILYTDENGKTNVSVRFASELLRRCSITTNAGLSTVILFFVYPNTGIFY